MAEEQLSQLAHKVLNQCIQERQTIHSQSIVNVVPPENEKEIGAFVKPSQLPASVDTTLSRAEKIFNYRVRMDHPRFFGFIPSPASDLSWLGEVLNSAYNTHAGSWFQSSGPSAVEKHLLSWLSRDIIGFPETAGGCFVSGGSMANLSALMVARDQKLTFEERSRAVAYTSDQTHSSLAKGLSILGFHPSQVQKIVCDDGTMRISTSALRSAIEHDKSIGKIPFLIVGNAGTTNTGSVDPFIELAAIAKEQNLWLHADGAYGSSVLLCPSRRHILSGLDRCDSLSWDAHKWLFQTYGCGMVFVRHRKMLTDSFGTTAEYTQDAAETAESLPNFWNYGPELTRPARAMKLWFSFQLLGLDAISKAIEHGFVLAETAQSSLEDLSDWEILSPAQMGIICFRFNPSGLTVPNLDDLNLRISQVATERKLAAPLTTRIRGVLVLRMCSIHPDLSCDEMVSIIEGLDAIARSLVADSNSKPDGM
ncbi:pyridoxal-dependent decarboxylase [Pochonia chlamydosporia 170]|uniref:Pyridoxal-dependent decarboxylase n=1 Tax=Pochonia chlamydosporia 170 TaxID=1380566 RepID=A0A179FG76_METCM|nr:pyridoxal-dependent decarboxylase [Pochonia chlamydosporia 170]OAQ64348.1 pyridoxal-dependent decarboxylase [Pochonia chlamydosporia 170]